MNKESNVIVSFTSYKERLPYVPLVIDSILKQTVKPSKIVLTLWKGDVEYITNELQNLIDNNIIELLVCDNDIKSHKKYYYCMKKYNNNPIMLIDDDLLYFEDVIEKLLSKFDETNISCFFKRNILGVPIFYSGAGSLFPKGFLDCNLDVMKLISQCITHDEIVLTLIANSKGIKINTYKNEPIEYGKYYVPLTESYNCESALFRINTQQRVECLVNKFFLSKKIKTNDKILLITRCKNENKYLDDFISYYSNLGIDNFIILDTNDYAGERVSEKNSKFIKIIRHIGCSQLESQLFLYDEFISNYNNFGWIIICDVDEYLTIRNSLTLKEYLTDDKIEKFQHILINFETYTDNNQLYFEDKPMYERFTSKADKYIVVGGLQENKHIKSIYNCNRINNIPNRRYYSAHTLEKNFLYMCDGLGNEITSIDSRHKINYIENDMVCFRHYPTKSLEEYIDKIKRFGKQGYKYRQKITNYFEYNKWTQEKEDYINKVLNENEDIDLFICNHQHMFVFENFNRTYKILTYNGNKDYSNLKEYCESDVPEVTNMQRSYGECSRMYWVWKKYADLKKYVGFCHYRRFFSFYEDIPDMDNLFKRYDAIVSNNTSERQIIRHHFSEYNQINFLIDWLNIINEIHPEYTKSEIKRFLNGNIIGMFNMFILKKEDFYKYMEWCFSIAEEFNKRNNLKVQSDVTEYCKRKCNEWNVPYMEHYDRLHGFLFEICETLYFRHNFKKILTLPLKFIE